MGRFRIFDFYILLEDTDKIVQYIGKNKGLGIWDGTYAIYRVSSNLWRKISADEILKHHPNFFKYLVELEEEYNILKEEEI